MALTATGRTGRAARWRVLAPTPGMMVGLTLFVALLVHHGVGRLMAELAVAGWGILILAMYHTTSIYSDAAAWRALITSDRRPSMRAMVWARWIGESVNSLLPVMQIGGNIVRARDVARRGVPASLAGASVVVDVTLEAVTQFAFALLGVGLLVLGSRGVGLLVPTLVGAIIMGILVGAFALAQRLGLFGAAVRALRRMGGPESWLPDAASADELDAQVVRTYGDRSGVWRGTAWHLLGWMCGVGEVWLALHFLGHPVDVTSAFVLESLGSAVRAAAFAVPGALGVQEGGFVVLGGVLGLPPDTCIALSLTKRAREILLGVPGLIAWQLAVSRARDRGEEA
jgi:putative membrane protein